MDDGDEEVSDNTRKQVRMQVRAQRKANNEQHLAGEDLGKAIRHPSNPLLMRRLLQDHALRRKWPWKMQVSA